MLYFNNALLLRNNTFVKSDFAVEDGKFVDFKSSLPTGIDLKGAKVIPGLFDVHTHGGMGYDFNTADTLEKMQTIVDYYVKHGATTVMATVMTDKDETICKQLSLVAQCAKTNPVIKGIHLEGPFLSKEYKGAMPIECLQLPSVKQFDKYQRCAEGLIKYVTVSPELPDAVQFVKYLAQQHIVASLGHSGATFEQALLCVEAGAKCFTHTFNAMRPIEHHNPSIAVCALYSDTCAEAIVDGKHLNRDIVRTLYKIKGDKLVCVTDSISPAGLPNGEYSLAGTPITVCDGDARIKGTNTRAGSTLNIFQGLINFADFCHIELAQAVTNFTRTQATLLGIYDKVGSLDPNKNADFLVLTDDMQGLRATFINGKQVK